MNTTSAILRTQRALTTELCGSEIALMSFLKLFIDTFVILLKREVISISLWNSEYSGFGFINDNEKWKKKNE